jgi:hypothetical protein
MVLISVRDPDQPQGHMIYHQKIPRLEKRRNAGLTYSVLAAILFKTVSLEMYTVITLFFFSTLQKHHGSPLSHVISSGKQGAKSGE